MKYWRCVSLFLAFRVLVSAFPLPHASSGYEISQRQLTFDKREELIDREDPPKTPTPEDHPGFPVPGRTGVFYDKKRRHVWMMYGDDLTVHAHHLMLNHQLKPANRKPMKLASVEQHAANRRSSLYGIPTRPQMARDEKPPAAFVPPDVATVAYAPIEESHREGRLLSKGAALMRKYPGSKGLIRANLGFRNPEPDMRLPISAPPRLPTSKKVGAKSIPKPKVVRATLQIPKGSQDSNKNTAGSMNQGGDLHHLVNTMGGMTLRPRLGPVIPERNPNVVAQKVKQRKDAVKARGKETYLVKLDSKLPPGQAWKPAEVGPTHAGAPLPYTNFESRRPEKFQSYAHMTHMKEEKEARHRLEVNKERRRVTLGGKDFGIAPHQSVHGGELSPPHPQPPYDPSLAAYLSHMTEHELVLNGIRGDQPIAGPSRLHHQDIHTGGSKSRSHSPVSDTESGHHINPVRPPGRYGSRIPVHTNRDKSASPPPAHIQHHSPPAHNTRSRRQEKEKEKGKGKGKEKEKETNP